MLTIRIDGLAGVIESRAVTGQDTIDSDLVHKLAQHGQGIEVLTQLAIRVGHKGCSPSQNGVAGQQRLVLGNDERQRI